ncbi:AEC family transporter [Campylobacter sp. US33a]|uniref:AEC family transporter n=1 Tax=Campylobacter sp. US33a TaxID=2498120 RepID=UPI0010671B2D|nr:AEC family transporter [Campylobacter sp. US33a]TEY00919.1 AEC family transporter [Campylobacter sp. US33a]
MFIFTPLFTVFTLLSGGYLAKRFKILKQKQSRTFLDFAIIFSLPCLIFEKVYHLTLDFTLILIILLGLSSCILAGLISVLLGKIFHFSKTTLVSMFLLSSFGNTLFVGIPIISGIYPDPKFIGEIILYDALATTLPISLFGPLVLSLASEQKVNLLQNIKKIITFPPFIALVGGIFCKMFYISEFIFEPIKMFGSCATAVALFAIGLSLGFSAIVSSYKSTLIVIGAKMLLAPLIFIVLAKIFHLNFSSSLNVAILESAMPTMTLAGAMIMKAKLDTNLAVSAVAFGILFAFISMPLLTWILL